MTASYCQLAPQTQSVPERGRQVDANESSQLSKTVGTYSDGNLFWSLSTTSPPPSYYAQHCCALTHPTPPILPSPYRSSSHDDSQPHNAECGMRKPDARWYTISTNMSYIVSDHSRWRAIRGSLVLEGWENALSDRSVSHYDTFYSLHLASCLSGWSMSKRRNGRLIKGSEKANRARLDDKL